MHDNKVLLECTVASGTLCEAPARAEVMPVSCIALMTTSLSCTMDAQELGFSYLQRQQAVQHLRVRVCCSDASHIYFTLYVDDDKYIGFCSAGSQSACAAQGCMRCQAQGCSRVCASDGMTTPGNASVPDAECYLWPSSSKS